MNKTNCIIVHGCPSDESEEPTKEYAQQWLAPMQKTLNSQGIPTSLPLMLTPWQPDYEKFKAVFEKENINENTILIGHSCGCAFLVRWLGDSKRKIKQLILVAPWKTFEPTDEFRDRFYTFPVDEKIKSRVESIVMFTSDNEDETGKRALKAYHDAMGGKVIELKGRGHYTETDMGTTKFPELLEEVLK